MDDKNLKNSINAIENDCDARCYQKPCSDTYYIPQLTSAADYPYGEFFFNWI